MPLETRKQARERTGKFPEAIGDDREAEGREAGQISVRADDDIGDLRREARDDMSEQRLTGKLNERLVGAHHTARFATRENDASNLPR